MCVLLQVFVRWNWSSKSICCLPRRHSKNNLNDSFLTVQHVGSCKTKTGLRPWAWRNQTWNSPTQHLPMSSMSGFESRSTLYRSNCYLPAAKRTKQVGTPGFHFRRAWKIPLKALMLVIGNQFLVNSNVLDILVWLYFQQNRHSQKEA